MSIKTTVVGSYPLPDWLAALPSEQALADAMRIVIHTRSGPGSKWCAMGSSTASTSTTRRQRDDRVLGYLNALKVDHSLGVVDIKQTEIEGA